MNRNSCEINEIGKIITSLTDKEVCGFLSEILTPTELDTISKRWRIIKMLNENFSQREIAKKLNVSLCKVTRGAKILKQEDSITNKLIKKELL